MINNQKLFFYDLIYKTVACFKRLKFVVNFKCCFLLKILNCYILFINIYIINRI